MKQIILLRGEHTLVDDSDFEFLSQWAWRRNNWGYVVRTETRNGRRVLVQMHRQIMGEETPMVDHIDGDTLNNQRSNLRRCTPRQNNHNRGSRPGSSSKYKGVTYSKQSRKWQAAIRLNDKLHYLGLFENEDEAGRAYDKMARVHHGEFARLNFPLGGEC